MSINIADLRANPEEVASRVNTFLGGGCIAKSNSISPFPDRDKVPFLTQHLASFCKSIVRIFWVFGTVTLSNKV